MSKAELSRLVALAREGGMSDADILRTWLAGIPSGNMRRQEVINCGNFLGLSEREALQIARSANLIPSTHPPQKRV